MTTVSVVVHGFPADALVLAAVGADAGLELLPFGAAALSSELQPALVDPLIAAALVGR